MGLGYGKANDNEDTEEDEECRWEGKKRVVLVETPEKVRSEEVEDESVVGSGGGGIDGDFTFS